MKISIRVAVEEDHPRIEKLARKVPFVSAFGNRLMFSSKEAYMRGWVLVAENELGEVVGFSLIREKVRQPHTVIHFIGVREDYRSQGIGRQMLDKILRETRHEITRLKVNIKNPRARELYMSIGFTDVETDGDMILMERNRNDH